MFIEPTFSTMLHKALTGKPAKKTDLGTHSSLAEDGLQVAIFDDQGREVPNALVWDTDVDFAPALKREARKVAN